MQWVFYSGYLSTVDIVFRFQLTIPPITELSIAETPNNRSCKTFLVRNFYTFYFRQSFTAQLKFPSMFVSLFLWQFDGLFRFTKMKFIRDFLYAFKFMVDAFPRGKDVHGDRARNINTIMETSAAHDQPPLLHTKNQHEPLQPHSCPLCWLVLSRTADTRQLVAFII